MWKALALPTPQLPILVPSLHRLWIGSNPFRGAGALPEWFMQPLSGPGGRGMENNAVLGHWDLCFGEVAQPG